MNNSLITVPNRHRHSKAFRLLLMLIWSRNILLGFSGVLVTKIVGFTLGGDVFVRLLIVTLVILSINDIYRNIKFNDAIVYFIFVIAYIFSMLLYSDTREYLQESFYRVLVTNVPVYFIGLSITKDDLSDLRIASVLSVIVEIVYILVFGISGMTNDNMGISYSLLPHVCLLIYSFFKDKKIVDMAFSIVGMFLLFSLGTKGPILLLFVCIIVYLFFFMEFRSIRLKAVVICLCISIMALVVTYSEVILLFIGNLVGKAGLSTRVLEQIQAGVFFSDNIRIRLLSDAWAATLKEPIFGYGIAGDRGILDGLYAHNLFLEFTVSFGLIFGIALFGLLMFVYIKGIKCRDSELRSIIVLLLLTNTLKLFLSSSYLLEYQFFLLIGLCISVRRRDRYNYYEE